MGACFRLGLVVMLALSGLRAEADDALPPPSGPVVLTVSGAITRGNREGAADFDLAMLESLGLARLATSTAWTDGVPVFEGVPMAALLDAVGAEGSIARGTALNGYQADLPIDEVRRYPVLLALRMNGEALRVRDKGPLWIIYPRDQYRNFAEDESIAAWIWQLRELAIR